MSELSRIDWSTVTLSVGQHAPSTQPPTMNVMEAHSTRRGQAWSDAPADVSPVVRVFCLTWQDTPDGHHGPAIRAKFLRRELAGQFDDTRASIQQERHRALVALDWLIRTYAVAWLRLVPALVAHAERLARVPPLAQAGSVVGSDMEAIEDLAWDARDTAYDLGGPAEPRGVDRYAPWTAERVAAWWAFHEAFHEAVSMAEWTAAGTAAANAARLEEDCSDAAGAFLQAGEIAAYYVAETAAVDAAEPTAAGAAAGMALQPTIQRLQPSAWALLDRLCASAPGEEVAPPVDSLETDASQA